MNFRPILYDEIADYFSYNRETGEVIRLQKIGKEEKGTIASVRHKSLFGTKGDRFKVCLRGKTYYAARIIWVLHNKQSIPDGMTIDHINGNRLDDRPENLRCVSISENIENATKAPRTSKSGLLGAYWDAKRKAWISCISKKGKNTHVGSFRTAEEAHAAYIEAKRRLHAGCTI